MLLFPFSDNLFVLRPPQWNLFAFRLNTLCFVHSALIEFTLSVTQIQRPRIWRPAASCLDCAYLNDETYNFCQRCGFRKEFASAQPVDPSVIDLDSISNRRSELAKTNLVSLTRNRSLPFIAKFYPLWPLCPHRSIQLRQGTY